MELDEVNEPAANVTSVNELKSRWNAIWKLQVQNRIKLLMWRAGSYSLPTKVNLTKRMLLTETTCTQCNQGPEDTLHALWTCPQLYLVCQVLFPELIKTPSSCSSFLSVIQLAHQQSKRFDLFAWMVSLIWL